METIAAIPGFEDRSCRPPDGLDDDELAAWVGMWFPPAWRGIEPRDSVRARQLCGLCPIQGECLRWANEHGEKHGIWGGLSAEARRQRRRSGWRRSA